MTPESDVEGFYYGYGINGSTGAYVDGPLRAYDVGALALADVREQSEYEARLVRGHAEWQRGSYESAMGVDLRDLGQCGWGVIFAQGANPAIKEALAQLLAHRREQAGDLFRIYEGEDGYSPGETWESFRTRHRAKMVLADPEQMPYYLLIVGDPETIPYSFQYHASVVRAVGRISFDDPADYATYARSVVLAEQRDQPWQLPRRTTLISACNPDDRATECSSAGLVVPLGEALVADYSEANWELETLRPEHATKAGLTELLGGARTPALLFAATHGAVFDEDESLYPWYQGALVTQEWPGPRAWRQRLAEDFLFSADDVADSAKLWGMIAIFLGSFVAGAPRAEDLYGNGRALPGAHVHLGTEASLGRLPKRLLSHPNGGALALVGHVERAWTAGVRGHRGAHASRDYDAFTRLFSLLSKGYPIGAAMEDMNARYSNLAAALNVELFSVINHSRKYTDEQKERVAILWTASNDARNLIIVGDPAVHISRVVEDAAKAERPDSVPLADRSPSVEGGPSEDGSDDVSPAVDEPLSPAEAPGRAFPATDVAGRAAPVVDEPDGGHPAASNPVAVDRQSAAGAVASTPAQHQPAAAAGPPASGAPAALGGDRRTVPVAGATLHRVNPSPGAVDRDRPAPIADDARANPPSSAPPVPSGYYGSASADRGILDAAAPTWRVPGAAGATRTAAATAWEAGGGAAGTASAGSEAQSRLTAAPRAEDDPELRLLWRKHMQSGYELNDELFRHVVDAFLGPYRTTMWMLRILFAIGTLSFICAIVVALLVREPLYALPFIALSVLLLVGEFVGKPLQALEDNLQFVTWLSMVYNTYWRRTIVLSDSEELQEELRVATEDAIASLEKLLDKRATDRKRGGRTDLLHPPQSRL